MNAERESSLGGEIAAMYEAIDNRDGAKAMRIISRLQKIIPDDPELVRGEYLARMLLPNHDDNKKKKKTARTGRSAGFQCLEEPPPERQIQQFQKRPNQADS